MRQRGPASQTAVWLATWLLLVALAPVVLVAGEPVNRYVMRRARWAAAAATRVTVAGHGDPSVHAVAPARPSRHVVLLFGVMRHPLWIALTAPGRWVSDQLRRPPARQLS